MKKTVLFVYITLMLLVRFQETYALGKEMMLRGNCTKCLENPSIF